MELNIKSKFGLIYENRMYVVEVPYREDRGALFQMPLRVVQQANFVVDLSDKVILKCRETDPVLYGAMEYGVLQIFLGIPTMDLKQMIANEPMLDKEIWAT